MQLAFLTPLQGILSTVDAIHASCKHICMYIVEQSESKPEPIMCDRPLDMFYAKSLSNTTTPSGNGAILDCPGKCGRYPRKQ